MNGSSCCHAQFLHKKSTFIARQKILFFARAFSFLPNQVSQTFSPDKNPRAARSGLIPCLPLEVIFLKKIKNKIITLVATEWFHSYTVFPFIISLKNVQHISFCQREVVKCQIGVGVGGFFVNSACLSAGGKSHFALHVFPTNIISKRDGQNGKSQHENQI